MQKSMIFRTTPNNLMVIRHLLKENEVFMIKIKLSFINLFATYHSFISGYK